MNKNKPSDQENNLQYLLQLSADECIIKLGVAVLSEDCLFGTAPSPKECYDAAKMWFEKFYPRLKSIICSNKQNLRSKRNEAIYVLIDAFMATIGEPASIFAAVYLVDYGLESFCKTSQNDFIQKLNHHK